MSDAFFNYRNFYDYIASTTHYRRFVEVGVYTGASVTYLAKLLLARQSNFELYAVDLWDKVNAETDYDRIVDSTIWDAFQERLRREELTEHIHVIQKESALAAADFADESVHVAFLDANHTEKHVEADIAAWLPKIVPGGMLAGHDYGEPCGVKAAVDKAFAGEVSLMGTCWYWHHIK